MRRLAPALLGAVIALGVSCGEEEAPKEPANPLAKAAQLTRAEGTARVRLAVRTKPRGQQSFRIRGVTRLDREAARLRLTYERYEGVPPGTRLEAVFAGGRYFFRPPGARRWVLVEEDNPDFATGLSESLPYLGAVVGPVKRAGAERLRGVATTAYRATVDLDLVDEQLPAGQQAGYRVKVAGLATRRIPVEVNVDAQGRLRRMRYDVDRLVRAPAGRDPGIAVVVEFGDFGVSADVRPPPRRLVDRG